MDLDDWELLPDYGFLEIHGVGGGGGGANKIFSTKYDVSSDPTDDFKTDYFSCPSPKSDAREVTRPPKQVIHLPVQLEPCSSSSSSAREIVFFDQKVESPKFETEHDDIVSQVSFKNIARENEFVEMKMDSPKSRSRSPLPQQIDLDSFQFEMENDNNNCEVEQVKTEAKHDDIIGGLNIWKRSLNGIGAICSFGVAAATFCFIVLGTQQKKNKKDIRFQIYADDKRIKQVMTQHAAKLNGSISAMRGVPLARAHITVGGYYDGL